MTDLKWEYLRGYGRGIITLTFYEPRWHGFARWTMRQEVPRDDSPGIFAVLPIKSGWWRPPRSWRCRKFILDMAPPADASVFLEEMKR